MSTSIQLVALAGSLRKDSYNQKLVMAACKMAEQQGAKVTLVSLNELNIPLYSQDVEQEAVPSDVLKLKKLFSESNGLLMASPEYNGSISGVLKNTIDWLSRPSKDDSVGSAFAGKVAGIMATSPGMLGGLRGLAHLKDILFGLGVVVNPTIAAIGNATNVFDNSGNLLDETAIAKTQKVVLTTMNLLNTTQISS